MSICLPFFRVDQGSTSKAVVLQSSSWYNTEGFTPASYVTDHGMCNEWSLSLLKVKWKQNFARCFVINTSQLKNRTKYTFLWLFASHRLAHKFAAHSRCWKYASGHFKLLFWTQRSFMTFAHGGNLVISLFDNWLLCRRYMTRWFYLNIKLQLPGGFIMPLFHKIMR